MALGALLVGLSAMALGIVVMLGWHLRLPHVVQILPTFVPMQYNTAAGFLVVGAALVGTVCHRWRVAQALGWLSCALGVLTLAEHVFGLDFGIDQLFMEHYITVGTSQPGRMAPNTALCFSLAGLAFVLAGQGRSGQQRWKAVGILAALVLGLSTVPLIGYVVGLSTAYGWGQLTRMAVHTAVGFVLLSCGLLALSAQKNLYSSDWLPWGVGVTTATMTITLWQAFENSGTTSAGFFKEFLLVFGLIMAFALARSIATAQKLRLAMDATKHAMEQLQREVVERQKAEAHVRELAFYDALTQLPNRRLMNERLTQALLASKRSGLFGAIVFLDLDYFKALNDAHGHAAGDLLLVEAAKRIRSSVRESDTVSRFAGDEFVVVLPALSAERDASTAQAHQVALKISVALSEPYALEVARGNTISYRSSGSVGVALFAPQDGAAEEILRRADAAMYQAKRAGRGLVVVCQDKAGVLPNDRI